MMDNTINGRTPEEIKARIDYCRNVKTARDCMSCPYGEDADVCASDFMFDSFDYMQYLESELAEARKDVDVLGEQVAALDGAYNAMKRERDELLQKNQQLERERDAAVEDINEAAQTGCLCYVCHHNDKGYCRAFDHGVFECVVMCGQYKWRGVEVDG